MPKFFYQIKARRREEDPEQIGLYGEESRWLWPPLFTGLIEAENRPSAIVSVHEEYGVKFPTRVLKKDLQSNEFLMSIKEVSETDKYTLGMFELNSCQHCSRDFKVIEKYQFGETRGGRDYCSARCADEAREVNRFKQANDYQNNFDFNGVHPPVIYKITNKHTGKCYVGKTTQAFTFRWYQHFFQSKNKDTDFSKAIIGSKLSDWTFEVIELVMIPDDIKSTEDINKLILARESHYINFYDSISNGYNSTISLGERENKNQVKLFESQ